VGLGGTLEQHVDRRPRVSDRGVDRQRYMVAVALDEQVVAGRGEQDRPRDERLLVLGLADIERRRRREQVAICGRRVGTAVLDDDDRRAEVRRQPGEQDAQRVEPAPRRADDDQRPVAHLVLR
jgi:hypothetical protein